jgi:hypothetical protein
MVMLVHGDREDAGRGTAALQRSHRDSGQRRVLLPRHCSTVLGTARAAGLAICDGVLPRQVCCRSRQAPWRDCRLEIGERLGRSPKTTADPQGGLSPCPEGVSVNSGAKRSPGACLMVHLTNLCRHGPSELDERFGSSKDEEAAEGRPRFMSSFGAQNWMIFPWIDKNNTIAR